MKAEIKSHSKSVCCLSSARGWKTKALLLMPNTQAESGELAKMRPIGVRWEKKHVLVSGHRYSRGQCIVLCFEWHPLPCL